MTIENISKKGKNKETLWFETVNLFDTTEKIE
jgi:hypothetical protein